MRYKVYNATLRRPYAMAVATAASLSKVKLKLSLRAMLLSLRGRKVRIGECCGLFLFFVTILAQFQNVPTQLQPG